MDLYQEFYLLTSSDETTRADVMDVLLDAMFQTDEIEFLIQTPNNVSFDRGDLDQEALLGGKIDMILQHDETSLGVPEFEIRADANYADTIRADVPGNPFASVQAPQFENLLKVDITVSVAGRVRHDSHTVTASIVVKPREQNGIIQNDA
jgi:hypothetical protein